MRPAATAPRTTSRASSRWPRRRNDRNSPASSSCTPSPGAGVGKVYFTADDAADAADRGEDVILVRNETTPGDVHGMMVANGLLTTRGGLVSHAAVVARGWGTPKTGDRPLVSVTWRGKRLIAQLDDDTWLQRAPIVCY